MPMESGREKGDNCTDAPIAVAPILGIHGYQAATFLMTLAFSFAPRATATLLIGVAALAWATGLAMAQQRPTPGSVEDSIRSLPRPLPEAAPPTPALPKPTMPPAGEGKPVRIAQVAFAGNSVIPEALLRELVQTLIKPEMTIGEISGIAVGLTTRLREAGYLLAIAVIPPQKLENGRLRVDILEGRIDFISVTGNRQYASTYIEKLIGDLRGKPAPTIADLEERMLLLNELPGLRARALLSTGKEPGGTTLALDVTESPYRATIGVSNHGSRELGQFRLDGSLDLYNPFASGDVLSVRGLHSAGGLTDLGRLAYSIQPFGRTRYGVSISRVDYRVGDNFTALDLQGYALTREISASTPLLRLRTTGVTLGAGARSSRTSQTALAVNTGSNVVNSGFANLAGYHYDMGGGATFAVIGLASNGRSNPSGTDPRALSLKADGDVSHTRPVGAGFEVAGRFAGAVSRVALPDSEKFSIGGPDSVRAYPIAQARGDRGFLASLEMRRRLDSLPGMQVGVFYDFATVRRVQTAVAPDFDTLRGVGVGATHTPDRNLRVRLDLAHALGGNPTADNRGRNRAWLSVVYTFQ